MGQSKSRGREKERSVLKKVVVIGESSVGKTCLVRMFAQGMFINANQPTTGVQKTTWHGLRASLHIWDIGGQERCKNVARSCYESVAAALVVCDITRPQSFDAAVKWKQDFDSNLSTKMFAERSDRLPALLLVNKCDIGKLPKTVQEMDAFCKEHGFIGWYETSAKANINVSTAFSRLLDAIERVEVPSAPSSCSASLADTSSNRLLPQRESDSLLRLRESANCKGR